MIRKSYYGLLQIIFKLLDFVTSFFSRNNRILSLKLKIAILLLSFKGLDASGQIQVNRARCYIIMLAPLKATNIAITDRFPVNSLKEHTLQLKTGYKHKAFSPGVAFQYYYPEKSFGLGPYFRLYTLDLRYNFHFIESGYQFDLSHQPQNEFYISSGFVLFAKQNRLCLEISGQYTYQKASSEKQHTFMPVLGIHYFFNHRKLRFSGSKKQQ